MANIKFSDLPVNSAAQNLVGVYTSNGISSDVLVPNETGVVTVQVVTPTTRESITSDGSQKLVLNPSSSLTNLTIIFPASPANGQTFGFFCTQTVTTLSLSPESIINAPGFLTANSSYNWYWSSTINNWISW